MAFIVLLCLFILAVLVIVGLSISLYLHKARNETTYDEEDEFDGKKGTLEISASHRKQRQLFPLEIFRNKSKVHKTASTKPLVKNEGKDSKNGKTRNMPSQTNSKHAKEMDDLETIEIEAGMLMTTAVKT